jgi:hypothetical protein
LSFGTACKAPLACSFRRSFSFSFRRASRSFWVASCCWPGKGALVKANTWSLTSRRVVLVVLVVLGRLVWETSTSTSPSTSTSTVGKINTGGKESRSACEMFNTCDRNQRKIVHRHDNHQQEEGSEDERCGKGMLEEWSKRGHGDVRRSLFFKR